MANQDIAQTAERYFRMACEKNALRRSSGLPLLDVREEMARLARQEEAVAYSALVDAESEAIDQILAETLAELRATKGPEFGYSAGGRWIVGFTARKRIEKHLREARLRAFPNY